MRYFSKIGIILIFASIILVLIITLYKIILNIGYSRNYGNFVEAKTPRNITPRYLIESEIIHISNRIYDMTDREFEFFTAKLLAFSDDCRYKVTSKSNDGGKDVILWKDGKIIYLECKHFKSEKNLPGRPVAQKFCGAMVADNVTDGLIVTLNGAHQNCIDYCNKLKNSKIAKINIEILNLNDLLEKCLKIDAYTVYKLAGIANLYLNIK